MVGSFLFSQRIRHVTVKSQVLSQIMESHHKTMGYDDESLDLEKFTRVEQKHFLCLRYYELDYLVLLHIKHH